MHAVIVKRWSLLAAVLIPLLLTGAPAHAGTSDVVTGALAFEGRADLSAGTFDGRFTGDLSGSYRAADGQVIPWTVLMAQPGDAAMTSVEVFGCAAGTVTGRLHTKTDDYGQILGMWVDNEIPWYIVAVDATFDFVWHRSGSAGPLVITDAVVDIQLYSEPWTGFGTPTGWVRVVDGGHVQAGAGVAHLDTGDPTSCDEGVLRGTVAELAVAAP